jgi:hypothetical protein
MPAPCASLAAAAAAAVTAGGAHIHSSYGEHFPDEGLDDKNYK